MLPPNTNRNKWIRASLFLVKISMIKLMQHCIFVSLSQQPLQRDQRQINEKCNAESIVTPLLFLLFGSVDGAVKTLIKLLRYTNKRIHRRKQYNSNVRTKFRQRQSNINDVQSIIKLLLISKLLVKNLSSISNNLDRFILQKENTQEGEPKR